MTPLDRELLVSSVVPDGQMSLPRAAYTDDSVLAWEMEHFFDQSWVCVGRSEDLRDAGDRKAVALGHERALLVRGEDGSLRAFYNVCRHRGHDLLEVGCTASGKFIRCPYHAWAYGLDGSLLGTPGFGGATELDKDDFPLLPVRLAEWHGWVFLNASGDAPSFEEHVGDFGEKIVNHSPGELVTAAGQSYEVAANWKILAENYHECYHCSSIHPELCKVSPPRSGEDYETSGAWVGGPMDLEDFAETMSLDGRSHAPRLPHLAEGQEREVYYFQLFPNLLISLHPDYIMTHRLRPLTPSELPWSASGFFPVRRWSPRVSTPPTPATSGTSPTARTGPRARASSAAPPRGATARVRYHPMNPRWANSWGWSPVDIWRVGSCRYHTGPRRSAPPSSLGSLTEVGHQLFFFGWWPPAEGRRLYKRVDRHASVGADDQWVDVEGADEVTEVPRQNREA